MANKYNKSGIISYINTPLSRESINMLYSANNIKPESVEKLYDMVRLLRNGDVVHIEATHRKLSGFDEHHILSNFSELTPRFYYQSSELPKASVDYLAKLYPDMYHSGD